MNGYANGKQMAAAPLVDQSGRRRSLGKDASESMLKILIAKRYLGWHVSALDVSAWGILRQSVHIKDGVSILSRMKLRDVGRARRPVGRQRRKEEYLNDNVYPETV
jgi:hypothetical protein